MNLARKLLELALGPRLPIDHGTIEVPGLERGLTIRRDRWGVPHIEAETEADAWYGLGFCQGQDRGFQLELLRRICRGTLAELVGSRGLAVDRLSRRLGLARGLPEQLAALDHDVREIFDAFCRGVNQGRSLGCPDRPHELALLRREPAPWEPGDVLAMTRFVGFIQSMSWDTQLVRLKILADDGPEALRALEPGYAARHPVSLPPGAAAGANEALDRLTAELARFQALAGGGGASNNWAIGGARTRSGAPLLANDPHLDPGVPSQWYLSHLYAPGWAVAGASFAGTPGIIAGHNGRAAWGVTNGKGETARLRIERLGPDGRSVWRGAELVPCQVVDEVIGVRGGEPVTERVVITPHGPIIGPAIEGAPEAISLRATWLTPGPVRGFLAAARARTFQEFRREFAQWPSASLNIVYADAAGTIGWQFTGQILAESFLPEVESPGDPLHQRPFAEMPWFEGGNEAYIGTANNRPRVAGEGEGLGVHWTAGYRAARIYQALGESTGWDVERCLGLQMDRLSLVWREVRAAVLAVRALSEASRQALALLGTWNGEVSPDSPAAAVFELLIHEITVRIVKAKVPRTWDWACGRGVHRLSPFNNYAVSRISHTATLLMERPDGWFARGWERELDDALAAVVRGLRERFGKSPERWRWGELRPLTFVHVLGTVPPLDRIFNLGPFPWGGDATTLSMCTSDVLDPLANPIMAATLRMVVDLGDPDASRFVLQSGQSGNPLSPHYDDMLPLWRRGDAIPLAWSEAAVRAATVRVLRLEAGERQGTGH